MTRKKSVLVTLVLGASMVACGQVVGEAIEAAEPPIEMVVPEEAQSDARASDFPADPYGCMFTPGLPMAKYWELDPFELMVCMGSGDEYCSLTGPAELTGLPFAGGYSDGLNQYKFAQFGLCLHTCQVDADCPMPASGTASPYCWRWSTDEGQGLPGECRLSCANDETCPNGFYCFDPGVSLSVTGETIGKSCYAYDMVSSDDP